jgi:hypothetical protein
VHEWKDNITVDLKYALFINNAYSNSDYVVSSDTVVSEQ